MKQNIKEENVFFNEMSKGQVDVMQNRAVKLRVWAVINIFLQNVSKSSSTTKEDKNIILKKLILRQK